MTALDPAPIIARLRDQRQCTGVYDPRDVEALIATTEHTGELATPTPLPSRPISVLPHPARRPAPYPHPSLALTFPRGGRSRAPSRPPPLRPAPVVPIRPMCAEQRDRTLGHLSYVCTELAGHEPDDHVARGADGRELARWSSVGGP